MLVRIRPPGLSYFSNIDDFVAQRHEVVRDGERGGPAPMQAMRFPFFGCGNLGQALGDVAAQIGGDALEPADGDRLSVHAAAAAGRLAGAIAGAAQNRRGRHSTRG